MRRRSRLVSTLSSAAARVAAVGVLASAVGARAQEAAPVAASAPDPSPAVDPGVPPAVTPNDPPAAGTVDQPAAGQAPSDVRVPTYVDAVERGARLRLDLGGRMTSIGLPNPPVRLEVDEDASQRSDIDVGGLVMFGWDRPFGVPVAGDFFMDGLWDVDPDSPTSPFIDDQSSAPRARLYSAFIGLSPSPGDGFLAPFRFNIGRMTQIVESPITYDGASVGARFSFGALGSFGAKLWGGIDAPQRLVDDPFTRADSKAYSETYVVDPLFVSSPGNVERQFGAPAPVELRPVGGLSADARFFGVGLELSHSLLPVAQRSRVGASYLLDTSFLLLRVGADTRATNFLPRVAGLDVDFMTVDGLTRAFAGFDVQFLEDECVYDCTFIGFDPATTFVQATADTIELQRRRDSIRHLNIGPTKPHVLFLVDAERELPLDVTVHARVRARHHFDELDLDYFRSNLYETAAGASWRPGMALDLGTEIVGGLLNTGPADPFLIDTKGEGLASFFEGRLFARSVLVDGKLSTLQEVFVRRQDLVTRAYAADGQWSGAFASSLRYDVFDFWQLAVRLEADALSPFDTANGTGYFGALAATSFRI